MQLCTSTPVMQRAAPRAPDPRQIEPDQLRAAAANIEHQREVAIAVDQRSAARHGELGFGLLRHDLDGQAGLAPRPLNEIAAVGGDAAGLGGDQPRAGYRAPAHLLGADLERFDGPAHGRVGQPARAQHAFAEADDAGERVDDEKAPARGLGDQQPAIIGAEIERAINERRRRPRRPRPCCLRLPPGGHRPARQNAHGLQLASGRHLPRSRRSRFAWYSLSREAMAAGRASPLGPFTVSNLSPPEPSSRTGALSVRCVGPMWLIYQAIVGGKAAYSELARTMALSGAFRRRL